MDNPPGFVIQSIWALGDSTERFGVSGNRRNLQCELTAKGEEIKPFKLIQTILTQVGEVSRRWGWGGGVSYGPTAFYITPLKKIYISIFKGLKEKYL